MWSKGNRSRRLSVTDEVIEMMGRCGARNASAFGTDRPAFFAGSMGNPVSPCAVGTVFHRIWEAAGLPESKGGRHPRPYDFRHRFAYANIERWRTEGTDVAAMMPYLARYMNVLSEIADQARSLLDYRVRPLEPRTIVRRAVWAARWRSRGWGGTRRREVPNEYVVHVGTEDWLDYYQAMTQMPWI